MLARSSRSQNSTQNRDLEREEYLLSYRWISRRVIEHADVGPSEILLYLERTLSKQMVTLSFSVKTAVEEKASWLLLGQQAVEFQSWVEVFEEMVQEYRCVVLG